MLRFLKNLSKIKFNFILLFCDDNKSKKPFIQFVLMQANFC